MSTDTTKKKLSPEQRAECQRLKAIFESKKDALGFTQESLGHELGISQAGIGHYLNGRNPLNLSIAKEFAKHLQVSIADFSPRLAKEAEDVARHIVIAMPPDTGSKQLRPSQILSELKKKYTLPYEGPERRAFQGGAPIFAWDAPEDLPPDQYVIVPRVDVQFSAGKGKINFEEVRKEKGNAFRHDWIRQRGLNPKNLITVYVSGDSMEPVLPDGASVTLDISKTTIEEGKVYGIRYGDELRIKRLKKRFDGSLVIQSDNPKYEPEIVPKDQLEHITVIGRYVGHCYDGEI